MNSRIMTAKGVIAGALLGLAGTAYAADFDGSKPLICAPVEAHDCVADLGCEAGTPNAVGAPGFMRIDFKQKVVIGPKRTTAIKVTEQNDAQILLMGTELDLGWTMALDRESGALTITFAGAEGAYVLFGSCTPI